MTYSLELSNPSDLIGALIRILGFVPTQQTFVVFTRNECLVEIVELDGVGALKEVLDKLAEHDAIDSAVIVSFALNFAAIAAHEPFRRLLSESRIELLDELIVCAGFWRSAMCADFDCCPIEGTDLRDMQGEHLATLGDLPTISLSEIDVDWQREIALAQANASFESTYFKELVHEDSSDKNQRIRSYSRVLHTCENLSESSLGQLATLVADLSDVRVRDALLKLAHDDLLKRVSILRSLLSVMHNIPYQYRAVPLTLVAALAWMDGNAALTKLAVERALDIDPEYSLARLLRRSFTIGAPSQLWRDSVAQVSLDDCLAGVA